MSNTNPERDPAPSEPSPWSRPGSADSASEWPSYPGPGSAASPGGPYEQAPLYSQPSVGSGGEVNPYAMPAYGSNPYGAQYAGTYGGYLPPTHPSATVALVLGIVGLVTFIPLIGIPAFVLGRRARRDIDANPGVYGGRGIATAGWVLGIVGIVLSALVVVAVILFIVAVVSYSG